MRHNGSLVHPGRLARRAPGLSIAPLPHLIRLRWLATAREDEQPTTREAYDCIAGG
jgi:hypothetical protein